MQMTQESIDAFLEHQTRNGASKDSLRQRKGFVSYLYQWLPDDKLLTRECLAAWREDMQQKGYTQQTILNYVKGINMYLDYMGWSEIRFNRGKAKDIRDITFGYLTPIEPTEKRHRKDVVWRCKCKCGNIVEMPATRLLTGNTLSCGCMKVENILSASKHIAGTHLFQSLKEDAPRSDNLSGYVGVSPNGISGSPISPIEVRDIIWAHIPTLKMRLRPVPERKNWLWRTHKSCWNTTKNYIKTTISRTGQPYRRLLTNRLSSKEKR